MEPFRRESPRRAQVSRAAGARQARCAGEGASASTTPSSHACAPCACSTPPAARATSSTSRCGSSRTSRTTPSLGARSVRHPMEFPQVGPEAVLGIEINPYAAELARVIDLDRRDPMAARTTASRTGATRSCGRSTTSRRATRSWTSPTRPTRRGDWPEAEFIVGNPPFLGGNLLLRRTLATSTGDPLQDLRKAGSRRVGLCLLLVREGAGARSQPARPNARDSWRRRDPRRVEPEDPREHQGIWRDLPRAGPTSLDPRGANVHISFVGFDDGSEKSKTLDGLPVMAVNANLTAGLDLTRALASSART